MNSDLIIACIIVGTFFMVLLAIFVYGMIHEWIIEEQIRKSYTGKIDKMIAENWNI